MESNNPEKSFSWQQAIEETYQDLSRRVVENAPELIGAVMLLLFGWLVAHLLRMSTRKMMHGFDLILDRVSKTEGSSRRILKYPYSIILSNIVYWATLVFFIAASANLLGWDLFTGWMDGIVGSLPNLIMGMLVILAGYFFSNAASVSILRGGGQQARLLARIAKVVILFSSVMVGIELIGFNIHFLTTVVVVIVGILLTGAALAFGLGARTMVANIVGAQYVRKQCMIGDQIRVNEIQGNLLEITHTNFVLETEHGRTVIPGKFFHEQVCHVVPIESPSVQAEEEEERTS